MSEGGYVSELSIGGSDAGAIVGLNRYQSRVDVWQRLMAVGSEVPVISGGNRHTARGIAAEPEIIQLVMDRAECEISVSDRIYDAALGFPRHASMDGIVIDPARSGPGVFEAKALGRNTFDNMLSNGLNESYYTQVQHYLAVTGMDWARYGILDADEWERTATFDPAEHLVIFDVERDEPFIGNMSLAQKHFWETYVLTRTCPEPLAGPLFRPSVRVGHQGEDRSEDPEWQIAVEALRLAREEFSLVETKKKLAEQRVKSMLGDRSLVFVGGVKLSYKWGSSRNFNAESKARFMEAHPEIDIDAFYNESRSRTFRPTFSRR